MIDEIIDVTKTPQEHAKRLERKRPGRKTLDSKEARRILCIRWARLAHKAMREKGIIPGSHATAARKRIANERKMLANGQSNADLRVGSSSTEGI